MHSAPANGRRDHTNLIDWGCNDGSAEIRGSRSGGNGSDGRFDSEVVAELPHPATNSSAATSKTTTLASKVADLFPEVVMILVFTRRGGGRGEVTRQHGVRNQANYANLGIPTQYR